LSPVRRNGARRVLRGRRRGNAPPLPDWRIWFYLLEAAGLSVQLVRAQDVKQAPGRPKSDPLTELRDVFAAQAGCASQQPIAEMSATSESPGCCGLSAGPIATETGHTELNQSPAFSSLPIFDVSRSRPSVLLQCP